MKSKQELTEDIINLTLKINNSYPELSKYLNEMPISKPNINNAQIDVKILQDYYNSLLAIFRKYAFDHGSL